MSYLHSLILIKIFFIILTSCSGGNDSSSKTGSRDRVAPKLTLTSPGNRQDISGLSSLTLSKANASLVLNRHYDLRRY